MRGTNNNNNTISSPRGEQQQSGANSFPSFAPTPIHKITVKNNGQPISPRKQQQSPSFAANQSSQFRKKKASQQQQQASGKNHPSPLRPRGRYEAQKSGARSPPIRQLSKKLTVSGAPAMINDRSQCSVEQQINTVTYRIQQHINEGTQASFNESFSSGGNYGNVVTEHVSGAPMLLRDGQTHSNDPKNQQVMISRLMESRSSVLIPVASSQARESNMKPSGIRKTNTRGEDEQRSLGSHVSLPYNQDFNIDQIQIRQSKQDSPTHKGLRKAATNAHMLNLSFKKSNEASDTNDRKQYSQMMNLQASKSYDYVDDGVSPVIITSLDHGIREKKKDIVFDVRSQTPKSEQRGTPNIGYQHSQGEVGTQHISVTGTDNRVTPIHLAEIEDNPDVRLSSPIYQAKEKPAIEVDKTGEPVIPPLPVTDAKSVKDSNSKVVLNTMSISLFDTVGLKSTTITSGIHSSNNLGQLSQQQPGGLVIGSNSPFRQSNNMLKSNNQFQLLTVLDEIAMQSEVELSSQMLQQRLAQQQSQQLAADNDLSSLKIQLDTKSAAFLKTSKIDENLMQFFKEAIRQHEGSQKKQWKNMTPYERSKVLSTFQRLKKAGRDPSLTQIDPMHQTSPDRQMQQDLSTCIRVGEIKKPKANPYQAKLVEKKLEITSLYGEITAQITGQGQQTSQQEFDLKFDDETLRDPKKIIAQVVKIQSKAAIKDAEQIDTQRENFEGGKTLVLNEDLLQQAPVDTTKTETALLGNADNMAKIELDQRKDLIIRENIAVQIKNEPSSMGVSPAPSVLHQRYPYHAHTSDLSLIESSAHMLKPIMTGSDPMPTSLLSPRIRGGGSTVLRDNSQTNSATIHQTSALNTVPLSQDLTPVIMPMTRVPVHKATMMTHNNATPQQLQYSVVDHDTATPQEQEFMLGRQFQITTHSERQSSNTLLVNNVSHLLPAVPEEQSNMMNMTHETLAQKIKETLNQTHSSSIHQLANKSATNSIRNQKQGQTGGENSLQNSIKLQNTQNELQEMTEMNLQAISLTKRHQIAQQEKQSQQQKQVPLMDKISQKAILHLHMQNTALERSMQELHISPTAQRLDIAQQNSQSRPTKPDTSRFDFAEQTSSLSDLRPSVQQQVLNKPKLNVATEARIISRDETELENLNQFVIDHQASKHSHQALSQLEARLREKHGIQSQDQLSQHNSQLHYLEEPKLAKQTRATGQGFAMQQVQGGALTSIGYVQVKKDTTKGAQMQKQNMLVQGSSGLDVENEHRQHQNTSTQLMTQTQHNGLGIILGKKMQPSRQPIPLNKQQKVKNAQAMNKTTLMGGKQPEQQSQTTKLQSSSTGNYFLPKVFSGQHQLVNNNINTTSQKKQHQNTQVEKSNKGDGIDERTYIDETVALSSEPDTNHLINHRLDEQSIVTRPIQEEIYLGSNNSQESPEIKLNALNKAVEQDNHQTAGVGASCTFYNERRSPDLQTRNDDMREKANSQMLSPLQPKSPERSSRAADSTIYHQHKDNDNFPGPIAAETPMRNTRIIFNENSASAVKEESGDGANDTTKGARKDNKGTHAAIDTMMNSDAIKEFQETANFANQMHRSTGLPANKEIYHKTIGHEQNNNQLKQSFATTISVIGAPNQSQVILGSHLKGKYASPSKFATISTHLVPNHVRKIVGQDQGIGVSISHRYSQSVGHRSEILNSAGKRTLAGQQSFQGKAAKLNEVFIDKRQPQGKKLFVSNELQQSRDHQNKMANLGFALSPLARRGQQILSLGSSRRNIVQTKTPISKILTENEMSEFQRCIGQRTKGAVVKSPGPYFKAIPPTREIIRNQVSTSRMVSDPADNEKASKLSYMKSSGHESPHLLQPNSSMGMLGQIYTDHKNSSQEMIMLDQKQANDEQKQSSQLWQPIKTTKPIFGAVIRSAEKSMHDSQESFVIEGVNQSSRIVENYSPTKTLLRNDTGQETTRFGNSKQGRIWQGNTMRSTRYLNNQNAGSVNEVKMIGLKAKINLTTESHSKMGISDLNSVLSSTNKLQGVRPETMIDSSDQADLPEIVPEPTDIKPHQSLDSIKVIMQSELAGLDQKLGVQGTENPSFTQEAQEIYQSIAPGNEVQIKPSLKGNNSRLLRLNRGSESPVTESSKLKQFNEMKDGQFTYVQDQLIQFTKGVLPRYKVELTKKRELVEQARQRYASTNNTNNNSTTRNKNNHAQTIKHDSSHKQHQRKMASPINGAESMNTSTQQRLLSLRNSRNNNNQPQHYKTNQHKSLAKSTKNKDEFFVFNDVKNWKKSVQKNNEIVGSSNEQQKS